MDEGGVGEEYMGTGAAVVRDLLLLSGAAESCGPWRRDHMHGPCLSNSSVRTCC